MRVISKKTGLGTLEKGLHKKPSYERALETVEEFQKKFGKQEKIPIKINSYGEYPWTIWPAVVRGLRAEGSGS